MQHISLSSYVKLEKWSQNKLNHFVAFENVGFCSF